MKVRMPLALHTELKAAVGKFGPGLTEAMVCRKALRSFRKSGSCGAFEGAEESTYGGAVLTIDGMSEFGGVSAQELRRAVRWYLDRHKRCEPAPGYATPLREGVDYLVCNEETV